MNYTINEGGLKEYGPYIRVTTIVMVGRGEIISGNNKSGGNND